MSDQLIRLEVYIVEAREVVMSATDGDELLRKATVLVAEISGGELSEPGLVHLGDRVIRVFVGNDVSLTPEDYLDPWELEDYRSERLLVAVINPIDGGKALLRRYGF